MEIRNETKYYMVGKRIARMIPDTKLDYVLIVDDDKNTCIWIDKLIINIRQLSKIFKTGYHSRPIDHWPKFRNFWELVQFAVLHETAHVELGHIGQLSGCTMQHQIEADQYAIEKMKEVTI